MPVSEADLVLVHGGGEGGGGEEPEEEEEETARRRRHRGGDSVSSSDLRAASGRCRLLLGVGDGSHRELGV